MCCNLIVLLSKHAKEQVLDASCTGIESHNVNTKDLFVSKKFRSRLFRNSESSDFPMKSHDSVAPVSEYLKTLNSKISKPDFDEPNSSNKCEKWSSLSDENTEKLKSPPEISAMATFPDNKMDNILLQQKYVDTNFSLHIVFKE